MNRKQRRADKSGKSVPPVGCDDPVDLHSLGVQAFREGRNDVAAELIARAIALDGQVASFHYNLAIVLKAKARLTEAAASYQCALALKPDYIEAHNNLGNVWKAQGERRQAQASFARALELRPGYGEAHYNLGVLFAEAADREQAAAHLQACLAQDPDDSRGVRMLMAHLGLEAAPARTPQAHLISLYDHRSRSWDTDRSYHGHELAARALRDHAPDGQLDVLDAGCGTGLVGALVRGSARQLDGVDLSPAMLERARDKQVYDQLYQDDMIVFLSAHPDGYDTVISAATLIHFGDLRPVFEAAARALRDGGLFVFTLFCGETGSADFAAAAHFDLARHGCYGHSAGYVERLAKETGFATELLEKVVHEHDLNGQPVAGMLAVLRRA